MARNFTGKNGTALLFNSGLNNHSGSGGLPAGCEWKVLLAKSPPGVVWLQRFRAILAATGEPCP